MKQKYSCFPHRATTLQTKIKKMNIQNHSSPFNNEDNFDSSFQLETNQEFNKIIESVAEKENNLLLSKHQSINLNDLLKSNTETSNSDHVVGNGAKKVDGTQQRPLSPTFQPHRSSFFVPGIRDSYPSSMRPSPTKDRFSKVSLVSDLSYNIPESLLDGKLAISKSNSNSGGGGTRPSSTTANLLHSSVNKRYSTISTASSKIISLKKSNGSFNKHNNRYSIVSNNSNNANVKRKPSYLSDSKRNSLINQNLSNIRLKYERSYSTDSSFIGYRNLVRSYSSAAESSVQYFDAVSVNGDDDDDEDEILDDDSDDININRFSLLKVATPGIVGVNIVNKNSNINDIENHLNLDNEAIVSDNDGQDTVLSNSTAKRNFGSKQGVASHEKASLHSQNSQLSVVDAEKSPDSVSPLPSPSKDLLNLSFESLVDKSSIPQALGNHQTPKETPTSVFSSSRFKSLNKSFTAFETGIKSSCDTKDNLGPNHADVAGKQQHHSRNFSGTFFYEDNSAKRKKSFNFLKTSLKKTPSIKRNDSLKNSVLSQNSNPQDLGLKNTPTSTPSITSIQKFDLRHTGSNHSLYSGDISSTLMPHDNSTKLKKQASAKPFFMLTSSSSSSNRKNKSHKKALSLSLKKNSEPSQKHGEGNGKFIPNEPLSDYSSFKFKFHKRSMSFGFNKNSNREKGMTTAAAKQHGSSISLASSSHHHANAASISTANSSVLSFGSKHKQSHSHSDSSDALLTSAAAGGNLCGSEYSVLSLNGDVFANNSDLLFNSMPARKIAEENEIPYMELHSLMNLCNSSNNLIVDFGDFIKLRMTEIKNKLQIKKIGELKFNDTYVEQSLKSRKVSHVLKIIPFGNNNNNEAKARDAHQIMSSISDVAHELQFLNKLQNCQGFIDLKSSIVVKGEYSKDLLREWDFFSIASQNSLLDKKKKRPDNYGKHQLYLILVFNYEGQSLKDFKLQSWQQANKLFWNLAKTLKNSEFLYQFEHRNLNWGNVLISNAAEKTQDSPQLHDSVYGSLSTLSTNASEHENGNINGSGTGGMRLPTSLPNLDLRITITDFSCSRIWNSNSKTAISKALCPMINDDENNSDENTTTSNKISMYRAMREVISKQNGVDNNTNIIDWSCHCPQTTILWLFYIADKLVNSKNLKAPQKLQKPLHSSSTSTYTHHSNHHQQQKQKQHKKSHSRTDSYRNSPGNKSSKSVTVNSSHQQQQQQQKSILRKPVRPLLDQERSDLDFVDNDDQAFSMNEYTSYQSLQYIHNSLNPEFSLKYEFTSKSKNHNQSLNSASGGGNHGPFFKSMLENFGDSFKLYKDEHFREIVHFEDFDNLDQVLKWGELNELII